MRERHGDGESYFVALEKLLTGNPRQSVWVHHASEDGRFSAGVWHSEIGKWQIRYAEDEYCRMVESISVITTSDGAAVTVRAGDALVIPRGFVGTWEVLQPTLKHFVIHEPDA